MTCGSATTYTGALSFDGAVTLTDDVTLTLNKNVSVYGAISGSHGIATTGSGTLAFYGSNTWTGPLTIYSGTAFFGRSDSYTMSNITSYGGTLTLAGITAAGTLTLAGTNNIAGTTDIRALNSGGPELSVSAPFGSGPLYLGDSNAGSAYLATLQATGTFTLANSPIYLGFFYQGQNSTARIEVTTGNTMTCAGQMVNNGSATSPLIKVGSGALVLSNSNNTYSGTTTVSNGTLEPMYPGSLPGYGTAGRLSVASGATLMVYTGSSNWTAGNIDTLQSNTAAFISGSALGFDTSGGDFPYSSAISNPNVGLVKSGNNTLFLSGANAYGNGTTINAGTLEAMTPGSLPNYAIRPAHRCQRRHGGSLHRGPHGLGVREHRRPPTQPVLHHGQPGHRRALRNV